MAFRRLLSSAIAANNFNLLKPAVKNSSRLPIAILKKSRTFSTSNCLRYDGHSSPDYYAVLGINRSATPQAVKLAYFNKAKEYHPDTNPSVESEMMFALIAEAYDVLSDEKRRKSYDEFGHDESYGGIHKGAGRQRDDMQYDPDELFEKIFGESRKDGDSRPETFSRAFAPSEHGDEVGKEYAVNLTFEEAALGIDYHLELRLKTICWKCMGSKCEPGYTWNICVYCDGTGMETKKTGHVVTRRSCSYCHGTKKFCKWPCIECEGTGQAIDNWNYAAPIPPGTRDGQVLKYLINEKVLNWQTDPEREDPYFFVHVHVDRQSYFTRDEDYNVLTEADISVSQAVLGGQISVRGLKTAFEGEELLHLEVPEMTSSHSTLTARNEGIQRSRDDPSNKGHHFVKLGIKAPGRLTSRQKTLLQRFAALETEDSYESGTFMHVGTVDGVVSDLDHRLKLNVIEPDEVKRTFCVETISDKEKAEIDDSKSYFGGFKRRVFGIKEEENPSYSFSGGS